MDADLRFPETDLAICDEWSSATIGLQPAQDYPADTKWQDGPDEHFGCIKGIVFGLGLSLPLWGAIIGSGMLLFKM